MAATEVVPEHFFLRLPHHLASNNKLEKCLVYSHLANGWQIQLAMQVDANALQGGGRELAKRLTISILSLALRPHLIAQQAM